jgi:hypothetical protein
MLNTRIASPSSPVVLLCGGYVPKTSSDGESVSSLRHRLTEFVSFHGKTKLEFFMPEEITNWRDDGVFPDLFTFELELAAICTAVILIIESPGSIAELGAFSQHEELRHRLLILNSNHYSDPIRENSFINLGILRDIKKSKTSEVDVYPWDVNNPSSANDTLMKRIVDSMEEFLLKFEGAEKLNLSKASHLTVFICELISVFVALQLGEIERYIKSLGFSSNRKVLLRKLFLLRKFKIIEIENYGSVDYYLRTKNDFSSVQFRYKNTRYTPLDVKLSCQRFYESANHGKRLGAIETVRERQK